MFARNDCGGRLALMRRLPAAHWSFSHFGFESVLSFPSALMSRRGEQSRLPPFEPRPVSYRFCHRNEVHFVSTPRRRLRSSGGSSSSPRPPAPLLPNEDLIRLGGCRFHRGDTASERKLGTFRRGCCFSPRSTTSKSSKNSPFPSATLVPHARAHF